MAKEEEKKDGSNDVTPHANYTSGSSSVATHVYVRSAEHGWVPARFMSLDKAKQEAIVAIDHYPDEQSMLISSSSTAAGKGSEAANLFSVDLKGYPGGVLPLQNVTDGGELHEYEDMVDLPYLHEAAILYNLKKRHIDGKPYTRSGDVVIAMNPYHWYHYLYLPEAQQYYADKLLWQDLSRHFDDEELHPKMPDSLAPHVYETATLTYKGMALWGRHQSILVSGESGAGKTETVKICMNHIATLQRGPPSTAEPETLVVERVLDSNPLLEAFGNAQTKRNDNSSRFGRYTQLQFDRTKSAAQSSQKGAAADRSQTSPARLAGSTCEVYLLEKNRVVKHDPVEERTFHIFYELLAAPDKEKTRIWEGLKGTTQDSFSYVGHSKTNCIEGVTDADRFARNVEALQVVGISGPVLKDLFRSLCVVLQLGNIGLAADPQDDDKSIITSEKELDQLASLMGIDKENIRPALTERTMSTRNEVYKVPLNAAAAKESCDGLAKDIYEKVFLWLVRNINLAISAEENYDLHQGRKSDDYGIIGLLDIFGFEVFYVNRFEQLCINYANEKLQSKFTEDCFKLVEAEYKEEGIPLQHINYDDNTEVLDLIEGRAGLLAMLNEECWMPQGNAAAFVNKALHQNKGSTCLLMNTMDRLSFGIHHYAGKVLYDADDFVSRNQDRLPTDLKECAAATANSIIRTEYTAATVAVESNATGRSNNSNLMATTVWTKYRSQLARLMADLHKTESRYIRCIKPNSVKEPLLIEHDLTIAQLRSCGIVASVTISRSAFPNKLANKNVVSRFGGIWHKMNQQASRANARGGTPEEQWKEDAQALLSFALKSMKYVDPITGKGSPAFIVGKTKTFFRAAALEYLEAERLNGLDQQATIIQKHYRQFLSHKETILALHKLRKCKAQHRRMAQERRARKEAEEKARKEAIARDAREFAERIVTQRREFEEKMAEDDRKFMERLKQEDIAREAEAEAEQKAWEEKMEQQDAEWKAKTEKEAQKHSTKISNDELARYQAQIAALTKEIEDMEDESDQKLKAIEEACLEAKKMKKEYEKKTDELEGMEAKVKREALFCQAIFTEREKLIEQLKRENKRLMKQLARAEEKRDAIEEDNEKLTKICKEKSVKFEKRQSLNMSLNIIIDERQQDYDKVKAKNQELHEVNSKHLEAFSLMTQSRLEAQHTLTAMVEMIRDGSNDKKLKAAVTHLNLQISKESYKQLKEVQKRQEEAIQKMNDYSVSDLHQSWVVH